MKKTFIILSVLVFFLAGWILFKEDKHLASGILNVALPSSVSNIECESWGFTDVLTTCVFEIDPKDFNDIILGREFEKKVIIGTSHEIGGPKLGENFHVASLYIVHPIEFKNGGHVRLYTNKDHNKVSIDIYIE